MAAAAAVRRRCIVALIASLAAANLALAMIGPLVSIVLDRDGFSATTIGLNAAMPAVALVALVFSLPVILRKVGAGFAMYAGLAIWAAAVLLMPVQSGPVAWLILRFLLSIGFCFHWVLGEAWVNAAATERNRGRVIGAYVMFATLGAAAGPAVLSLTGFTGARPFFVVAAVVAAAAVPLLAMPKISSPMMPRGSKSLADMARKAPVAMAMGLVAGFCDITLFSLFPVYGVKIGLSVDATMALLVAFLIGTAVTQLPLGWLAERVNGRLLLAACAFNVIAAAVILPYLTSSMTALLFVMFLWGGAQIGFYTLGLVELGSKFERNELVGANSIFSLMYGTGAFAGPLIAGAVMDGWGANGLSATVAAVSGVLLLSVAIGFAQSASWGGR